MVDFDMDHSGTINMKEFERILMVRSSLNLTNAGRNENSKEGIGP